MYANTENAYRTSTHSQKHKLKKKQQQSKITKAHL